VTDRLVPEGTQQPDKFVRDGTQQPGQDADDTVWARTRRHFGQAAWSLRRKLAVAFALAGALLVIGCVAGGAALNSMINAVNHQVNVLDPAARTTGYLSGSLLDQQTGVRGFVITRQQDFLVPYRQGMAQSARYARSLHTLVDPYPSLRGRLLTVESQASQWRTDYAVPAIAAVRHGQASISLEATGESEFGQLRASIAALNGEILAERASALHRLRSATTAVIVVAITAAVALIGAAAAAWAAMNAWVTRPLAALGREAQVVASGGLDHQLKVDGPREVIDLAADVEAMRRQLLASMGDLSSKATELQRSNRELEQFAYVASHDLQEPLRKVASFCQMLESRYAGQLDDRAHQYIAYAVDGAKRMQLLINELLTFSRVGQPGTIRGPVDLNAVAREAIERLDATITDTDADVTVGELPTITGDAPLLTQLFQNLIGNSIKFRRMDEHPVIRIAAERKDGIWEFACRDNGIGIAPAHAERVFVIFQRLHPRDAYPGTGIGLALCRKIVDFHGGRIWIDTQPDHAADSGPGTTIRWTLPGSDGQEETT
jgi:signal transduction histidine kinase